MTNEKLFRFIYIKRNASLNESEMQFYLFDRNQKLMKSPFYKSVNKQKCSYQEKIVIIYRNYKNRYAVAPENASENMK